jgi:hypothetical protein
MILASLISLILIVLFLIRKKMISKIISSFKSFNRIASEYPLTTFELLPVTILYFLENKTR